MTAFPCCTINNVHYNVTVQCFYRMEDIVSQLKILWVPCTKLYRKIMTAFSCRKINNVHYNVTVQCFYRMENIVSQLKILWEFHVQNYIEKLWLHFHVVKLTMSITMLQFSVFTRWRIMFPKGGTRSINDGGSGGASYCEPKKIHEPEIVHPKKYLASTFSTSKSARPSISILIYSVKQTWRP